MGKSIFRASSLTASPLPPMSRLWCFRGGCLLLPRAAGCARVRANNEMGRRGAQLLKMYFPVIFSHPWTLEKTNLCIIAGRVSIQVVPITAAFVLPAMIVFLCPSRSTAGACLTQPLGTERCPRLGQRPPVHLAVSFLECQYLCRRGALAATTICISRSIRTSCVRRSQVTVRSQSGHSQVYSQVTVRSCKTQGILHACRRHNFTPADL